MGKYECRRCGEKYEITTDEGFAKIAEIQGYQCPASIPGVGHWLRRVFE